MAFSPETAKPLNELAEVLLRAPSSLPQADREMIATYVSARTIATFARAPMVRRRLTIWAEMKNW
jgi:hypothetical protein